MRNVLIGLPAYSGTLEMDTVHLLTGVRDAMLSRGWGVTFEDRIGSGEIHTVRNYYVARALAGDFTDLIMIDDDVWADTKDLDRWLDAEVDFISGIYPTRAEKSEYKVRYLPEKELWADPVTGLLEVEAVPAGFIRISRECLMRMVYSYDGLKYRDPDAPDERAWGLFYPEIREQNSWSEDINFCLRWRAIGGKVWCDPMLKMRHVGRKVWEGCFGEWLRSRPPALKEVA